MREFGGEKCEIWIFHVGKSSSILFQRVWWLKIDCTLFLSPPNWIKTFKLNSLQTSPFLEKFLRSKGMKLFDRKVLWQIESQGKGGHLFLLGCWKKGQQQSNEPNLYRNFLLVTKWLFRARKVGPLWSQLIGGIDSKTKYISRHPSAQCHFQAPCFRD